MSIAEFSATINSNVFKQWLKKLDKNIVNATVSDIRKKEQVADKTDFILSVKDIKAMYKAVTQKEISNSVARRVLRDIANVGKLNVPAKVIRLGGSGALYFESIGFDTISKYVKLVFDNLDGVNEAYEQAREAYMQQKLQEINSDKTLTPAQKRDIFTKAEKTSMDIGFGYFLHKGHVVSLATNSAKNFKNSLQVANEFTEEQKQLLIGVLDKYIDKLEKDDLASANLPNAYKQEIYAKYIKQPDKYLVEIQLKSNNLEQGSASLPITNELRKIFATSGTELEEILKKQPAIGKKLLESKGSPSMLELLAIDLANTYVGKQKSKEYSIPLTKVATNSKKIVKRNNKKQIQELKALKTKTKAIKKIAPVPEYLLPKPETNLVQLLQLINQQLSEKIRQNMGTGTSKNILNYRTGRLAESAKVERLSESRQGMITAFYSYMKNPYATFSDGGRQQYPRSRDPKLLIQKSIREIAAEQVANRLRAVLV